MLVSPKISAISPQKNPRRPGDGMFQFDQSILRIFGRGLDFLYDWNLPESHIRSSVTIELGPKIWGISPKSGTPLPQKTQAGSHVTIPIQTKKNRTWEWD